MPACNTTLPTKPKWQKNLREHANYPPWKNGREPLELTWKRTRRWRSCSRHQRPRNNEDEESYRLMRGCSSVGARMVNHHLQAPARLVAIFLVCLAGGLATPRLEAVSRSLFFPHLISGMGFETRLTFTNPSSAPAKITVTARNDDGTLLTVNGIQNPATLTVPARQQVEVEASDLFHLPDNLLHLGWMQAESDNNQVVALLFAATSSQQSGAGIEASGTLQTSLVGAIPSGLQSAIALANPNAAAAQVSLRLFDAAGQQRSQSTLTIPARGHQALFLNEAVSGSVSPAQGGHFEIASSVGLSGLGVMTGLSGYTLTPLATPSGGPFIFPRAVNGPDRSTTLVLQN